jgi:beta-lactamase regulating signal transducer with metallopeptidase domain
VDVFLHVVVSNAVVAAGLAVVALAVGLIWRRPALTHALWLLVLLKLLTPPLFPVQLAWLPSLAAVPPVGNEETAQPSEAPAVLEEETQAPEDERLAVALGPLEGGPAEFAFSLVPAGVDEPPAPPPAEPSAGSPAWLTALLLLWLAGSLAWFALAGVRVLRFRRLLRHARPAPPALQNQVKRLARRLGLIRCPEMLLVPSRVAPMLWAWGGPPRLLVPAGLLSQVSAMQRATLLVHELAHLRRGDHWVRFLEFLAMGLCWWHPAVWLARRELREAEEQCCDAWVVWALPDAGRAYATALVETLDFLAEPAPAAPLLASGIGPVTDLKRRLTMIMRGTTPRSLTWGGVLTVLTLAVLLLPVLPTWAQRPQEKEEEEGKRAFRIAVLADDEDVQKAQANLQRLQADLEKKAAEIAAAKEKLKAAADQLKKAMMEKEKAHAAAEKERKVKILAEVEKGKGDKAKTAEARAERVIRIEVVVPTDAKGLDVKKLTQEIQKAVQGVGKINVHVETEQPGQRRTRVFESKVESGDHKGVIIVKPEGGEKPGSVQFRLAPSTVKPGEKGPAAKPGSEAGAKGKAEDARIEKLERRLDELIRELNQIRRDMRRSGSGAGALAPVPTPPTPVAVDLAFPASPVPTPPAIPNVAPTSAVPVAPPQPATPTPPPLPPAGGK